MGVIILYDSNVTTDITKADLAMSITRSDNIYSKIQELAALIQKNPKTSIQGWANVLHIVCNGSSAGLQLGQGIHHKNVAKIFLSLRFKIGNIIIHSCGAAHIYKAANNGVLMCKKLAHSTFTNVTASDSPCYFTRYISQENNPAEYTKWRGIVATWNQLGKLSMLQEYNNNGDFISNIHQPLHSVLQYFKRPVTTTISATSVNYFGKDISQSGIITRFYSLYKNIVQHVHHYAMSF